MKTFISYIAVIIVCVTRRGLCDGGGAVGSDLGESGTKCDSRRGALGGARREKRVLAVSLHQGAAARHAFLGADGPGALRGPTHPGLCIPRA